MKIKKNNYKTYYEEKIKQLKENINLYIDNNSININFKTIKYEKDNVNENEINYIYYSSCLRAKNYNIPLLDKMKIKIIKKKLIMIKKMKN